MWVTGVTRDSLLLSSQDGVAVTLVPFTCVALIVVLEMWSSHEKPTPSALNPSQLREYLRDQLFAFFLRVYVAASVPTVFVIALVGVVVESNGDRVLPLSMQVWIAWAAFFNSTSVVLWHLRFNHRAVVSLWGWCYTLQSVYLAWGAGKIHAIDGAFVWGATGGYIVLVALLGLPLQVGAFSLLARCE